MKWKDPEAFLPALGELAADEGDHGRPVSDADLSAYREGRLAAPLAEELEALLAASPALRGRLAELAGLLPSEPRPAVRQAVLDAFARERRTSRGHRGWWAAAAGIALAVVGLAGLLLSRQPTALPAYELTASALAAVRGEGPRPEVRLRALPETAVTLTVTARGAPAQDAEFGLYRAAGGSLRRLGRAEGLELEVERGTAFFRAGAGELLAFEPGLHHLFVVVAHRGDLPSSVPLAPGREPAQLLAAGGARVLPLDLELFHSEVEEAEP